MSKARQNSPCSPCSPYVVDLIFPSHQLHMFIGKPRVNPATLVLSQFIYPWLKGLSVFGHVSHPSPCCYVMCCDSLLSSPLPLPPELPAISLIDTPPPSNADCFDYALSLARFQVPNLEVLFVDGIAHICPGDPANDSDVEQFTRRLDAVALSQHITIFGIEAFDNAHEIASSRLAEFEGSAQ